MNLQPPRRAGAVRPPLQLLAPGLRTPGFIPEHAVRGLQDVNLWLGWALEPPPGGAVDWAGAGVFRSQLHADATDNLYAVVRYRPNLNCHERK